MEDLSIDLQGDYKFNYRVAGIIIHNGKILVHKSPKSGYYALLGGRLQTGETTRNAVIREFKEEIGKDIEIIRPYAFIENFFDANDRHYHETLVVYRVEFIDEKDKKLITAIENIEEGKDTKYLWLDIKELDNIDLRPAIMKKVIKEDKDIPVFLENFGNQRK